MSTPTATSLEQRPLPIQTKLAAAWTGFMFLYVYVDVLGLYKPGTVAGILDGKVWDFDISQPFFVSALAASSVPALMILLSTTMPARVNRATNLVVAALLVPWMAFNLVGGEWLLYFGFGFAVELALLVFILRSAWSWPRTSAPTGAPVSTLER
ncbi:MAG TPA: DUF6326 family protein [Dermatophilaceae bacterium]|nr:DUF6326 family protein [Dermatophilaceae bacterium]